VAVVAIDFPGAGEAVSDALYKHLSMHDLSVGRSGGVVSVDASDRRDCERLGQLLADFVRTVDGDYPLYMAGPGGSTRLFQLRTDEDTMMISGLLTACADLL
jgi:hypothetical protein